MFLHERLVKIFVIFLMIIHQTKKSFKFGIIIPSSIDIISNKKVKNSKKEEVVSYNSLNLYSNKNVAFPKFNKGQSCNLQLQQVKFNINTEFVQDNNNKNYVCDKYDCIH